MVSAMSAGIATASTMLLPASVNASPFARMIGIDHVGISSDFDGGGGIDGWNSAAEAFNVTLELVRRGYTEEQIGKLWSGDLLRVWGDVEKVSLKLRTG